MQKLQTAFKVTIDKFLEMLEKESNGNFKLENLYIKNIFINETHNNNVGIDFHNSKGDFYSYITNSEMIDILDRNFGLSGIKDSKIVEVFLESEEVHFKVEKEVE